MKIPQEYMNYLWGRFILEILFFSIISAAFIVGLKILYDLLHKDE